MNEFVEPQVFADGHRFILRVIYCCNPIFPSVLISVYLWFNRSQCCLHRCFDCARALAVFCTAIFACGCGSWKEGERVSLASTSPDGATRVEVVEITGRLDRNFLIRVFNLRSGTRADVYHSPDEGRPSDERIIWSRDGVRFALLGANLSVEKPVSLIDGRRLYLLYDIEFGDVRCNSNQYSPEAYARFSPSDLKGFDAIDSMNPSGTTDPALPAR